MRRGRCKYPVNILIRTDTRLRDEAGAILRARGSSLSEFVRGQLRDVVRQGGAAGEARP